MDALVQSANKLKELGASGEQIFIGDILDPTGSDLLDKAVAGCDALIIATSAVPKIQPLSLIKVRITSQVSVRKL